MFKLSRKSTTVAEQNNESGFLLCFQQTDPKTGEYPPVTSNWGQEIADRARKILSARSVEEFIGLLNLANYFLESLNPKGLLTLEKLSRECERLDTLADGGPPTSTDVDDLPDPECEVALLFWGLDRLDLLSPYDSPASTWPELFAILALGLLNTAAEDENYYSGWADKDEWVHDYRVLNNVSYWTQQAERAISISETLSWAQNRQIQKHIEQSVSKSRQAQQAAFARHEKTANAVLALTSFYQKGSFPSMSAAVAKFCEEHRDLVAHLAQTNRQRTLSERLGRQLRGREARENGRVD
jgi:hypothetical protein